MAEKKKVVTKKIKPIPNALALLNQNPPTGGQLPPFPPKVYNRTPCPLRESTGCPGFVLWNGGSTDFYFTCTDRGCNFDTRVSNYKPIPLVPPKPKKVKLIPDPPGFTEAFKEEFHKRFEALKTERDKFPPTLIKVGKGKKAKWKKNPKFTDEMAAHMHTFAFTTEQVRADVLKKLR